MSPTPKTMRPASGSARAHRLAVYPGSFDPLTNGHVDIIERGSRIFDSIIVAVLGNNEKTPLFSVDERVSIIKTVFKTTANVQVDTFDGLLVEYAQTKEGVGPGAWPARGIGLRVRVSDGADESPPGA